MRTGVAGVRGEVVGLLDGKRRSVVSQEIKAGLFAQLGVPLQLGGCGPPCLIVPCLLVLGVFVEVVRVEIKCRKGVSEIGLIV